MTALVSRPQEATVIAKLVPLMLLSLVLGTNITAASPPRHRHSLPATTTTAPTTTTTAAAPIFDGRASRLTGLRPESPALWSCECYDGSNVSLVSDPTYGRVYRYYTDDASTNHGGYDPGPLAGVSELTRARSAPYTGHWDWFRFAIKIPSSWRQPTWNVMFEPNFPELTSPPVAIAVDPRASDGSYAWAYPDFKSSWWTLARNVSDLAGGSDYQQHFTWIQPVVFDQWVEFAWGIDYETNLTGAVKVYSRQPGGTWSLKVDLTRVNTYQTSTGCPNTCPSDVQSLYEGVQAGWPTVPCGASQCMPPNTAYFQGYRQFATEADALAAP